MDHYISENAILKKERQTCVALNISWVVKLFELSVYAVSNFSHCWEIISSIFCIQTYLSFHLERSEFTWKCYISVTVWRERSGASQRWRAPHQQVLPCQAHHWYLVCNVLMIYEETVNTSTDECQSGKWFAEYYTKLSSCSLLLCVAWHETVLTGGEIFCWQAIKPCWKLLVFFPQGSTISVL